MSGRAGSRPGSWAVGDLRRRSREVVAGHQHPGGAYPAAPGFSAYDGYAWFRDGSFVADAMSRHGDVDGATAWHAWVVRVLDGERERVAELARVAAAGAEPPEDLLLPTRYRLDGSRGDDEWWDFQTDGLGTWLWSLRGHADRHGAQPEGTASAVATAVSYLCAVGTATSYDWWEEHRDRVHVASLACVRAGLLAAAAGPWRLPDVLRERAGEVAAAAGELVRARGTVGGRLAKWLGGEGLDASLLAAVHPFGLAPPGSASGAATVEAVRSGLCRDGGVHRYEADTFYGGGRWPLLTAFLGWNDAVRGDLGSARAALAWVAAQADDDGLLPEQVGPVLHPGRTDEWVRRWGPVARPLLWSHAMFLVLDDALARVDG